MSAKNVDEHNRFRSITVGRTEQSCSPVGITQTGILLSQVHGA